MDQLDIEPAANLYASIQLLSSQYDQNIDKEVREAHFDGHVRRVVGTLNDRLAALQEEEGSEAKKIAEYLQAKHGLYDICFQELINLTEALSPDLGAALGALRAAHADLARLVPAVAAAAAVPAAAAAAAAAAADGGGAREEAGGEEEGLRAELAAARAEAGALLEAAEGLEREVREAGRRADAARARAEPLQRENALLRQQVRAQRGNGSAQVYLSPKKAKAASAAGDASLASSSTSSLGGRLPPPPLPPQYGHAGGPRGAAAAASDGGGGVGIAGSGPPSVAGSSSGGGWPPAAAARGGAATALEQGRRMLDESSTVDGGGGGGGGGEGAPGEAKARTITFKQLKETIEAVYASKAEQDARHRAHRQPRETLEQHLYTYLNHKYGLRGLCVGHAAAVLRAVQTYSAQDNDVATFGKIVANEIDEEFHVVQKELKQTVQDLLRVHLKGKYPLKADGAIQTLLNQRVNGSQPLSAGEWGDVVRYMYNDEDATALTVMLRNETRPAPGAKEDPGRTQRISYSAFLKVLLDFQLHGHTRFLEKFRAYFVPIDSDGDGIITRTQFQELCQRICPMKMASKKHADQLVAKADPHATNSITYSDAVDALSGEIMDLMLETMSRRALPGAGSQMAPSIASGPSLLAGGRRR